MNTQWIHVKVLHHICTQVWLGHPSYLLLPFMVGQSFKEVGALAQFGLTTKSNLFPCRYPGFMICCMFNMQYKYNCSQILPALKIPKSQVFKTKISSDRRCSKQWRWPPPRLPQPPYSQPWSPSGEIAHHHLTCIRDQVPSSNPCIHNLAQSPNPSIRDQVRSSCTSVFAI